MNSTTRERLAYLAGILDGEGCIGLSRNSDRSAGRLKIKYRLYLIVGMCDREPLDMFAAEFGGNVLPEKCRPNNTQKFRYAATFNRAEQIIWALYPWLTVKRPQALLALDLRTSQKRWQTYSPADWLRIRHTFYEGFRELNKHPKP